VLVCLGKEHVSCIVAEAHRRIVSSFEVEQTSVARSILLPLDKTLPVIEGLVAFGTWESLVFAETTPVQETAFHLSLFKVDKYPES
jgi:thiamine phosphate synthase YjbQ (UPF0047 family)